MWCNECDIIYVGANQVQRYIHTLWGDFSTDGHPRIYREISKSWYPRTGDLQHSFPKYAAYNGISRMKKLLISIYNLMCYIYRGTYKHALYNFITHGYTPNWNCIIIFYNWVMRVIYGRYKINFPILEDYSLPYDMNDPWRNMGDMISALQLLTGRGWIMLSFYVPSYTIGKRITVIVWNIQEWANKKSAPL